MNILFIVPSYKPAYIYGGPIVVIPLLAETLVRLGHTVTVYTTTANGLHELQVPVGKEIIVDGVSVTYFARITGDHTHASPALWRHFNNTVRSFDVVHLHSWWNALIMGAAWICLHHRVTPILSPHGMFSNYILSTNNSIKKKLFHRLLGRRLLNNTRLHVSTVMELRESRQVIHNWLGAIIPNLVTLPNVLVEDHKSELNNIFIIGFLSRIDPKKGLDILIRALSQVNFDYRLRIAGDGEPNYVQSLKELAVVLGNADKLEWVGWQNGEAKFNFLSKLDLFALTSHSENFAIVVIEALVSGIPVLISDQVGLKNYVFQHDYGWITELNLDSICHQLYDSVENLMKRKRIATVAPAAIRAEYEDVYLAQQYIDLYSSIL